MNAKILIESVKHKLTPITRHYIIGQCKIFSHTPHPTQSRFLHTIAVSSAANKSRWPPQNAYHPQHKQITHRVFCRLPAMFNQVASVKEIPKLRPWHIGESNRRFTTNTFKILTEVYIISFIHRLHCMPLVCGQSSICCKPLVPGQGRIQYALFIICRYVIVANVKILTDTAIKITIEFDVDNDSSHHLQTWIDGQRSISHTHTTTNTIIEVYAHNFISLTATWFLGKRHKQ